MYRLSTKVVFFLTVLLSGMVVAAIIIIHHPSATDKHRKLTVTASFYPLYDFARHVGSDKVRVVNLTPNGSEPHDYEPTPKQLVETSKSGLLIYNGGTLEPWVDKFIPTYRQTVVKASTGITLQSEKAQIGKITTEQVQDPHFWLDPHLAETVIDNIRAGLVKADPHDKDYFTQQAQAYKTQLAVLDHEYQSGLAACQTRTIVTSHDAFSYLGKRYNLEVVSIAGFTPDQEPSAAKLAELTQVVRAKHIKYVFFESLVSPKLAETVAQETGTKTAVFDPIEGVSNADQKKGKDYLSIQRQNLANLRTALSCR